MLKSEYKVTFLERNDDDSEEMQELEGKKKEESFLIANKFQKATIINLRACEINYEKAAESKEIQQRFPAIRNSMHEFLNMNKIDKIEDLSEYVEKMRTEVYDLKQDRGQEYAALVDFFNRLIKILKYNDVVDNYPEFKLLMQYPKITPYMYLLENVKSATLKELYNIVSIYYGFRDFTDFVLTYFIPIYDNFGISDQSIRSILKKAEKSVGKRKF